MLAIHTFSCKLSCILFHVHAHQPVADLLIGPLWKGAVLPHVFLCCWSRAIIKCLKTICKCRLYCSYVWTGNIRGVIRCRRLHLTNLPREKKKRMLTYIPSAYFKANFLILWAWIKSACLQNRDSYQGRLMNLEHTYEIRSETVEDIKKSKIDWSLKGDVLKNVFHSFL